MTTIDLGADVEFKVLYGGKEYTLREPTVKEIEIFKASESAGENGALVKLLADVGLPSSVAESMPVSKLKKLIDGLIEGMTGKK